MKLKSVFVYALLVAGACLAGCASNYAPPKADAIAKLMQPVEGKAVIYVFRNNPATAPKRIRVTLDGKTMGETSVQTYFRWEVSAGQHIIVSYSRRWSELVIDAEPGRIYYVWQDVGFFDPTSELKLVDRDTAEINLRSCYLLENES